METEKIREVNDTIRAGLPLVTLPHKVVFAGGLAEELSPVEVVGLLEKVKNYSSFDEGSDPWGGHNFGEVYHNDEKIFFKFDYYDKALEYHGYDRHVLTIMYASDY